MYHSGGRGDFYLGLWTVLGKPTPLSVTLGCLTCVCRLSTFPQGETRWEFLARAGPFTAALSLQGLSGQGFLSPFEQAPCRWEDSALSCCGPERSQPGDKRDQGCDFNIMHFWGVPRISTFSFKFAVYLKLPKRTKAPLNKRKTTDKLLEYSTKEKSLCKENPTAKHYATTELTTKILFLRENCSDRKLYIWNAWD